MRVLSVVFLLGALVGLAQLPAMWRGNDRFYDRDGPGPWWPYSKAAWRAWVRGMPPAVVAAVLMGVGTVIGSFAGKFDSGAEEKLGDTTTGVVMFVLFVAAFAGFLLSLATLFVNRPRWLVAPRFRQDRGLFAEWRNDDE
jgi:hypothetical protein